LTNRHH